MGVQTSNRTFGKGESALYIEADEMTYWPAQRLAMRLLKLAGPGVIGLVAAGDSSVMELFGFFEKLSPEDAETISREILSTSRARYNGKIVPLVEFMDVIVGGDFWLGIMIQAFALSVIFGNFTNAPAALVAIVAKAKQAASAASTTLMASKGANSSAPDGQPSAS